LGCFSSNPQREERSLQRKSFLKKLNKKILVKNFKGFPFIGFEIKVFEELKLFNPDIIFTHFRDDLHQDHRLISDLTWNTFRNHLILEYEIKYDGDLRSLIFLFV